jgi:GT2 family glycosyltransferase
MISVIIVQYNKVALTRQAIRSFKRFHGNEHELIVVDNGSADPTVADLRQEFSDVKVILNEKNLGFGAANNIGAKIAKGELLFFLNNDTITISSFVSAVEQEFRQNPKLGALGLKLLNSDHSFQLSAGHLPTFWREIIDKIFYGLIDRRVEIFQRYVEKCYNHTQTVGWVTGAALFIRKDLFMRIGGFDEAMFMYFEDKDLCLRVAREAAQVLYEPVCSLIHLKGGTSITNPFIEKVYRLSQLAYYEKHRPAIEQLALRLYLYLTGKYPK